MSSPDTSQQVANLINAIASLEAQRAFPGDAIVSASIEALQKQLVELENQAEQQRKLVTVLFMDVVGSTKLGESLDPEDVMEISTWLKSAPGPLWMYGRRYPTSTLFSGLRCGL